MPDMEKLLTGIVALFVLQVCVSLRAYTPDDMGYAFPLDRKGFNLVNLTSFKFKLKACTNGHIILQKERLVDLYTEGNWAFLVGSSGNIRSEIAVSVYSSKRRYGKHDEVLLDCSEFRPFWVSWKDGLLQLGKGSIINANTISAHQIIGPNEFNYAFILTGWGSDGCWDIDTGSAVMVSQWKQVLGNQKLSGLMVKIYHSRSQIECTLQCVTPAEDLPCGCVEYSYNMVTKQCLVVDESDEVNLVDAPNWKTWNLV